MKIILQPCKLYYILLNIALLLVPRVVKINELGNYQKVELDRARKKNFVNIKLESYCKYTNITKLEH